MMLRSMMSVDEACDLQRKFPGFLSGEKTIVKEEKKVTRKESRKKERQGGKNERKKEK